MEFSLEATEELLIIDTGGNGEVELNEFCHFIVMMINIVMND